MSADNFARKLSRHIVADISGLCGYHTMRQSASDILCDLLKSYIVNVGYEAVQYSHQANRTEQNVFDVAHALKFIGNTRIEHLMEYKLSIAEGIHASQHSRELEHMHEEINLSLFESEIPRFPVDPLQADNDLMGERGAMSRVDRTIMQLMERDERDLVEEGEETSGGDRDLDIEGVGDTNDSVREKAEEAEEGEGGLGDRLVGMRSSIRKMTAEQRRMERERQRMAKLWELSLPSYLPQLPPKHTYVTTPVYNERMKSSLQLQKMKTRQKRRVEASLTRIYERELELREQEKQQQEQQSGALQRRKAQRRKRRIEDEWYQMYESMSGLAAQAEALMASASDGTAASASASATVADHPFEKRQKTITNPYLVVMKKSATGTEFDHEADKHVTAANVTKVVSRKSKDIAEANNAPESLLVRQPRVYKSSELISKDVSEDHVADMIAAQGTFSEKLDFNRKKAEGILNQESAIVSDSSFSVQ